MKFNELLSTYNSTKSRYKSLLLELQELKELGSLPRRGVEGMPSQRSNSSPVENYVIRIDEIERKLQEIDSKMLKIRNNLQIFIGSIEDESIRQVVEICVFRNTRTPDWKKIARCVCYSETHTRRLYNKGLEAIQNLDMEVML